VEWEKHRINSAESEYKIQIELRKNNKKEEHEGKEIRRNS
jgi:hypothetical protein